MSINVHDVNAGQYWRSLDGKTFRKVLGLNPGKLRPPLTCHSIIFFVVEATKVNGNEISTLEPSLSQVQIAEGFEIVKDTSKIPGSILEKLDK